MMTTLMQWIIGLGAIAFFVWLIIPTGSQSSDDNTIIDPNDSRQIGMLIGMTGGDITDAAVARYAIQRFQEQHGRAPTTRDIGTIIGLMRSL